MSVNCEECGKLYHITPDQLEAIKLNGDQFKCKECGHVIEVSSLDADPVELNDMVSEGMTETTHESYATPEPTVDSASSPPPKAKASTASTSSSQIKTDNVKVKGLGLRSKMLILFLVIPLAFMTALGLLSQNQMQRLTSEINRESARVVGELAAENIAAKVRAVALQCRIFLSANPQISKEDFNWDTEFKRYAVQKIGETGSTFLAEIPSPGGVWIPWAHPDPQLIGKDMMVSIRQSYGEKNATDFWNIAQRVITDDEAQGTYLGRDDQGKQREMFMFVMKMEHTPYTVGCITYLDEFTKEIDKLQIYSERETAKSRNINLLITLVSLIIIGSIITVYAYRLTKAINYLTDAADRISVGELDAEIIITSNDEIGNLAEAISRMQDSLRFSMERLRRRR